MGESLIMAARIALLLALVAISSAIDWHYEFRHPTVTPNPRADNPFRPSRTAPVQPPAVRGTKAVPNCGQSKSTKIVGGSEVTPHAYPWQVGLFIDDMYFCGGSIISEDWILTAAHCMDGAGFVEVVMGAHSIHDDNEVGRVSVTSTDFFTHENWNSFTLTNDLALIRMPSLKFSVKLWYQQSLLKTVRHGTALSLTKSSALTQKEDMVHAMVTLVAQ